MTRHGMKILFFGGIGGLSPIICRYVVLSWPALNGNQGQVKEILLSYYPQDITMIYIDAFVLICFFIVGSGLAIAGINRRVEDGPTWIKAMVFGMSAPALIFSMGISANSEPSRKPSSNAPLGTASSPAALPAPAASVHPIAFITGHLRRSAAGPLVNPIALPGSITLDVNVKCNRCPSSESYIENIGIENVKDSPAQEPPNEPGIDTHWKELNKNTVRPRVDEQGEVELVSHTSVVMAFDPTKPQVRLVVPDQGANDHANNWISDDSGECVFPVVPGDTYVVDITLGQEWWNNLARVINRPPFYIVRSIHWRSFSDASKRGDCTHK